MTAAEIDPGIEFAGAQFESWRKKKGVTQRQLMSEKVISHVALRDFEKGRSWPRERMRAKLEERLELPPGQIAEWRYSYGAPAKQSAIPGRIDFMLPAVEVAVQSIATAVDDLPPSDTEQYWPAVVSKLRDLRKIDSTVSAVARMAPSETTMGLLRTVRGVYDDLLRAAAAARPNELGPQLYLARTAAQMSINEAASAAGVSDEVITAVESCQLAAPPEVQALLERMGRA
ncbi:helix-turn-helix domain-containing protein [Mycolicibacterium mageritense]|uniref:helix-turn-helix domain-containing protein n=1 Tax=Mycolicibacterium mageritense TaxID=53462 RepID=UPI0011D8630B|nr:helix-turn-helix transcriptional regulator [Mycolicibacterium mageritense]TXI53492.1 MAG: XRE family transcriptional regulator [Mycolicibacterium mageritense]